MKTQFPTLFKAIVLMAACFQLQTAYAQYDPSFLEGPSLDDGTTPPGPTQEEIDFYCGNVKLKLKIQQVPVSSSLFLGLYGYKIKADAYKILDSGKDSIGCAPGEIRVDLLGWNASWNGPGDSVTIIAQGTVLDICVSIVAVCPDNSGFPCYLRQCYKFQIDSTGGLSPMASQDKLSDQPYSESSFADLILYPNPATDVVNVGWKGSSSATMILRNNLGQELQRQSVVGNAFQLSTVSLPGGVYFLELNDGKSVSSKRLSVNK